MRYYGLQDVAGAPGNTAAFLVAGSPSFEIGPRSPFKGMPREQLEELKKFDDRPGDLQKYYDQINAPGPQLPFPSAVMPGSSNLYNAIGNMQIGNVQGLLGNPAMLANNTFYNGMPPIGFYGKYVYGS